MIFVDTNVFMYAVGRQHPLRYTAREFFAECIRNETPLCTSAEVMQELAHAYLPVARLRTLDRALALISRARVEVWPLEQEDVNTPAVFGEYPCPVLAAAIEASTSSIRPWEPGISAISPVVVGAACERFGPSIRLWEPSSARRRREASLLLPGSDVHRIRVNPRPPLAADLQPGFYPVDAGAVQAVVEGLCFGGGDFLAV